MPRKLSPIVALALVVVLVGVTWAAFTGVVSFPTRLRPRAQVMIDENGNLLFGGTPAKVEVTNLADIPVGGCPSMTGTPWRLVTFAPTRLPYTVPSGFELQISDVTLTSGANGAMQISFNDGADVQWNGDASVRHVSLTTPLVFGAGETPEFVNGSFVGRLVPTS